jgi:hypothetical protein
MDTFELFADLDLGRSPPGDGSCVKPIGRRAKERRRRPRVVCSRRSSTTVQLIELRGLLERQHAELMGEVCRLRQQRRNDHESLPAVLRRISEIERHLRLAETPEAPKPSRRHPMGA